MAGFRPEIPGLAVAVAVQVARDKLDDFSPSASRNDARTLPCNSPASPGFVVGDVIPDHLCQTHSAEPCEPRSWPQMRCSRNNEALAPSSPQLTLSLQNSLPGQPPPRGRARKLQHTQHCLLIANLVPCLVALPQVGLSQ